MHEAGMSESLQPVTTPSELLLNLLKDGGRTVMYGGDPYEDDVERDVPPPPDEPGRAKC
jgi:hypothetical protein